MRSSIDRRWCCVRTNRKDFPAEDSLPRDIEHLFALLQEAKAAKLSYRYTNVIRHRLMDAVAGEINEGRL